MWERNAKRERGRDVVSIFYCFNSSGQSAISPVSLDTALAHLSSQLIYGTLVSLTDFFDSCVQTGGKLTVCFSSLSSLLSSTSSFSRLTTNYNTYNTCSDGKAATVQMSIPASGGGAVEVIALLLLTYCHCRLLVLFNVKHILLKFSTSQQDLVQVQV